MIELYTPATGFPDLEAKIAYGLARVGLEIFDCKNIEVEPFAGFYKIRIKGDTTKLESNPTSLARRILSSRYIPANTPGITGTSAKRLSFNVSDRLNLDLYRHHPSEIITNEEREPVCHHDREEEPMVSNVIGLAASTSYHHARDFINVQKDKYGIHRPTNPKKICKNCSSLALLGTWFATFIFPIKDREVFITPLVKEKIDGERLTTLFSIQHQLRNISYWVQQDIPLNLVPIIFLSKIPTSIEILNSFDLFIAILSRQQGYHVDGLFLVPLNEYIHYFSDNSFNIAMIDIMIVRKAFGALSLLNSLIIRRGIKDISKFARLYVQETSPKKGGVNLLYPATTNYILREVAMMKPEIIKNEAISSIARTLRYFVRERKYHYADSLRNARKDSRDFEEILTRMLREARLRLEQEKKIHLPNEEEIKEVFQLAEQNFDEVKTAIVLLSLSFPSKKEELD